MTKESYLDAVFAGISDYYARSRRVQGASGLRADGARRVPLPVFLVHLHPRC